MTTPEYIHILPPATSQCREHSAFVAQTVADLYNTLNDETVLLKIKMMC